MKNKLILSVLFCILCMKGYATISPTNLIVCSGLTLQLTDNWTGGTWTSSNPSIASIGTSSGLLTGGSAGTAIISYHWSIYSPLETKVVTVNAIPDAITGNFSICVGATSTLSCATGGGTWSSSAPSIATINSSGLVTGVIPGTSIIRYTLSTGCKSTTVVTVNEIPGAIGEPPYQGVCIGYTATYTVSPGGGTWTSSAPSFATIAPSTGVVTGVSVGSGTVSYTLPTGCARGTAFACYDNPPAVTGPDNVCVGATITMSCTPTDAVGWVSSNTAIATATNDGVVTGVSAGTVTITFLQNKISGGGFNCFSYKTITVGGAPITGDLSLCVGETSELSTSGSGGTWSSTNTGVATVGSTGIVTGVTAGTSTISYYIGAGCTSTAVVTVNAIPIITGTLAVCIEATSTLSVTPTGGTWSSGNTGVATVGSSSGIVTGVSSGTAVITYSSGAGCITTAIVTVSGAVITGTATLCLSSVTTLNGTPAEGTWSSSNTDVATVGSSGVVTGVSSGTAVISYVLGGGCYATVVVTVNGTEEPIVGCLSQNISGVWHYYFTSDGSSGLTVIYSADILNTSTLESLYDVTPTSLPLSLATGSNPTFTEISISDFGYSSPWKIVHSHLKIVGSGGCTWINTCGSVESKPAPGDANPVALINNISIVPNPNSGTFNITGLFGTSDEDAQIDVLDLLGNVVYHKVASVIKGALNHSVTFDKGIANGVYLVKVTNNGESRVVRFVLSK